MNAHLLEGLFNMNCIIGCVILTCSVMSEGYQLLVSRSTSLP